MASYTEDGQKSSNQWLGTVKFPDDADEEWVRGGSTIITRNMTPRGYTVQQQIEKKIIVKFTIGVVDIDAHPDLDKVVEDWNDCVHRAGRFDPENLGIEPIVDKAS